MNWWDLLPGFLSIPSMFKDQVAGWIVAGKDAKTEYALIQSELSKWGANVPPNLKTNLLQKYEAYSSVLGDVLQQRDMAIQSAIASGKVTPEDAKQLGVAQLVVAAIVAGFLTVAWVQQWWSAMNARQTFMPIFNEMKYQYGGSGGGSTPPSGSGMGFGLSPMGIVALGAVVLGVFMLRKR